MRSPWRARESPTWSRAAARAWPKPQIKLLGRFTQRVVVNYDPDTAGQAATERSLTLLLEQDFDVRVLALPGGADPDKFI